jgi:hypothetical protein
MTGKDRPFFDGSPDRSPFGDIGVSYRPLTESGFNEQGMRERLVEFRHPQQAIGNSVNFRSAKRLQVRMASAADLQ